MRTVALGLLLTAGVATAAAAQPSRRPPIRIPPREGTVLQPTTPQPGTSPAGPAAGGEGHMPTGGIQVSPEPSVYGDGTACVVGEDLSLASAAPDSAGNLMPYGGFRLRSATNPQGPVYYLARTTRTNRLDMDKPEVFTTPLSNSITQGSRYWWDMLRTAWAAHRPVRLALQPLPGSSRPLVTGVSLMADGSC